MGRDGDAGAAMTLYHRTCDDGARTICATGLLRPNGHPRLRRPVVWMADRPDRGRLALGLTSLTLSCDRMAHLFAIPEPAAAIPWAAYASRMGYPVDLLGGRGAQPSQWWVSEQPQVAVELDRP